MSAEVSPVLLILWIRPHLLEIQISQLRQHNVSKVYVSIDGPRISNYDHDRQLIDFTLSEVYRLIDWDCELIIRTNEKNQGGSKYAVFNAISWVFSFEEMAIILEDDCIPSSKFLKFSSILLDKYINDYRIWSISGTLRYPLTSDLSHSYYFSIYPDPWGWATWSRCWNGFLASVPHWDECNRMNLLSNILNSKTAAKYWTKILAKQASSHPLDAWDYQWSYYLWINNGLSIQPFENLIDNMGTQGAATHTFYGYKKYDSKLFVDVNVDNMMHPNIIANNPKLDSILFHNVYGGLKVKIRFLINKYIQQALKFRAFRIFFGNK